MAMQSEWDTHTYEEPVIHVRNYLVSQIIVTSKTSNNINMNQNKSEGLIFEKRWSHQDTEKKLFSEICCSCYL
jgi:hypothetical protein